MNRLKGVHGFIGTRGQVALIACVVLVGALLAPLNASAAGQHTWYVKAGAPPGGNGSMRHPFSTLLQVEEASSQSDTIIVEPSPVSVAPLNGGIALKAGQRLIGGGPPVVRAGQHLVPGSPPVVGPTHLSSLPRIENTSNATNNGDAVELAPNAVVRNMVITGAYRGDIYGRNVPGVRVQGNDLSGGNTSGTAGFIVLPFKIETYTPFLAIGNNAILSLKTGWAEVLIDATSVRGRVVVANNYVHDSVCANGIDVRTMGTANLTSAEDDNFVTRLKQCSSINAVQGMSTQASGSSTLHAQLIGNTEADNGNTGANADSLFANPAGSGTLIETIDHNTFVHGIGGASTNGLEFITSLGQSPVGWVKVTNSTFHNDPGDMLEEFNRGVDDRATLILDRVLVEDTTISGGIPTYAIPSGSAAVPDNTGECLGIGSVGAGDNTVFQMIDSRFVGCDNNGIEVTNNHVPGEGAGSIQSISLDIEHSEISGSRYYNLWVNSLTPLGFLHVRVEDSDLSSSSSGVAVAFAQQPTSKTAHAVIDLGGGALGSVGRNCIFGGAIYDLQANRYNVAAEHNWWGSPAGAPPGAVTVTSGIVNDSAPLSHAPEACNG